MEGLDLEWCMRSLAAVDRSTYRRTKEHQVANRKSDKEVSDYTACLVPTSRSPSGRRQMFQIMHEIKHRALCCSKEPYIIYMHIPLSKGTEQ